LEVVSLYFILPGIILFLWGWSMLRALVFPLFYLQFMIPWTDGLLQYVFPLARLVAATLASWFLSLLYPVIQEQTSIHLPDITLLVVSACSGVNFIISVTAIGLILGYLTQKTWPRVFVVVLLGAVLTILFMVSASPWPVLWARNMAWICYMGQDIFFAAGLLLRWDGSVSFLLIGWLPKYLIL